VLAVALTAMSVDRRPGRAAATSGVAVDTSEAIAAVPLAATAVLVALHTAAVSRSLSRHGIAPRTGAILGLRGLGESAAALGQAATMLAGAPLTGALLHPRTRRAALALLLAAPIRDYLRLRPSLDPLRFAVLGVVDDAAYGAGVWAGSLRAHTWGPLRPRLVRDGAAAN